MYFTTKHPRPFHKRGKTITGSYCTGCCRKTRKENKKVFPTQKVQFHAKTKRYITSIIEERKMARWRLIKSISITFVGYTIFYDKVDFLSDFFEQSFLQMLHLDHRHVKMWQKKKTSFPSKRLSFILDPNGNLSLCDTEVWRMIFLK